MTTTYPANTRFGYNAASIVNVSMLLNNAETALNRHSAPGELGMSVRAGELAAYVRMLGAWIEAHAARCEIRTGSAL